MTGKDAVFFLVATLAMVAMVWYGLNSSIDYTPINTDGIAFVTGKVAEVVSDDTEVDERGIRRGRQDLRVELLSGVRKGETIDVVNTLSIDHNVYVRAGQRIIVYLDQQPGDDYYFATVQSFERSWAILAVLAMLFGLMAAVGGRTGLRSAFGLVFTFVVIFSLLIPLIVKGVAPIPLAMGLILCIIVVSLISILGFTKKTLVSIIGTGSGVVICCALFALIGIFLRVTGYNVSEIDSLVVISYATGIDVGSFLFVAILISSLGAVMDVSVSVASSVAEISEASPDSTREGLFRSGVNIGRDIVGATLNTLIMAFTGASLITLILFRIYKYPFRLLINHNDIAIEVLQAAASSAAMILSSPITAYAAARFYGKAGGGKGGGRSGGGGGGKARKAKRSHR